MAFSKDISTYPAWMMEVARWFAEGGDAFEETLASHGAAINARQQFYAFRKLLRMQGGDVATGIAAVQVTLVGESTLRFQTVDTTDTNHQILNRIAEMRAQREGTPHPLRRSTDLAPELSANTTDETSQPMIKNSTVGQMDDQGTNAILNRYGFEE